MRTRRRFGRLSLAALSTIVLVAACGDDDGPTGGDGGAGGNANTGGNTHAGGAAHTGGAGGKTTGGNPATGGDPHAGGAAGSGGAPATGGNPHAGAAADDGGVDDGGAPDGGGAVGDTYLVTSSNRLLSVERATGAIASAVTITGLAAGDTTIVGADIRPADGVLYAVTSSSKLYTVALDTGVATLKATLSVALEGTRFGVDWNPVPNRLRVVSDTGQNLRIDADTGTVTTDGRLNPGTPAANAAAYTNSFAAACRTRLYVIDAAAKTLFLQDPPNDGVLTAVGPLGAGVMTNAANAFEIETADDGTNSAFAAFTDGGTTRLYDVNLTTGAATGPRTIALASGEEVRAMSALPPAAAPVQGAGELYGVTVSNKLVSFNRAAPGKLCTSAAITGLQTSENVLGIDVRPADAALYALGSTGRLYTVAPATGAATLKSTLLADAADTSNPFTALDGTDFGVGFNPVPDRLRVTSNTGQNLRINVDSGATTTDVAINPAGGAITEVAYSNSFAGARSTTLFGIDTQNDGLVRIGGDPATGGACPADAGNPNCGVRTAIGAFAGLAGDVTGVSGFDIDGRTGVAGSAVAALTLGAATTSTLFNVDLDTGAIAAPGATIGGGERLRGLTFAANPTVTAYGLTTAGRLVGFKLATPGALVSDVALSGLTGGETLVGVDFRSADGKLYGVGSANRLYTVNPATGEATQVALLTAAAGDATAPFSAIASWAHGVDFNPAADLLRVVGENGDNLRIVPSARTIAGTPVVTGAVFTDATLNPLTPVNGAAYTRNFAGATVTTLFGVDTTADVLVRQGGVNGPPSSNDGLITPIGPLGVDAVGSSGFDIAGGRDGLVLAALRTTGTRSVLYVVNLATGAAAPYLASGSEIGVEGSTAALQGLAIELK